MSTYRLCDFCGKDLDNVNGTEIINTISMRNLNSTFEILNLEACEKCSKRLKEKILDEKIFVEPVIRRSERVEKNG